MERLAPAWAGDAQARLYFVKRTVRCTYDVAAILRKKTIRHPVQRVSDVYAIILVSENLLAFAYHETIERPVAIPYRKFPASRVGDITKRSDHKVLDRRQGSSALSW